LSGSEDLIVEVDIATRVVGDSEDIYIVRPGANYALYDEFVRTNRVFLDFPGLGLNTSHALPETTTLREMIARSMLVREWHVGGQEEDEPERQIAWYAGKARGRRFGRYAAAIEKLYYDLPEGTIIVVPGPGLVSDVRIGILDGRSESASDIEAYPGEHMPVRRVRWIGKKQRSHFSAKLRDRLGNSHPVMALDRSMREEILEAGFDRFVFGGQFYARLETTKAEFNTLDDYNIQTFVNFVAGAMAARDEGLELDHELTLDGALALLAQHRDLIPELTVNINSPGFLRMISDRIAPLVIAMLFSVATAVPAGAQPTKIVPTNSAAAPTDPCAVTVASEAMGAMKLMGYDDWKRACEKARDAQSSTGVKTNMKTSVKHPGN
jgi:hypothetical protein